MDDSGQRQIVEIMSGGMRQRPGLPPSRHAREHQTLIPRQTLIRTKTQLFTNAGTVGFDLRVRLFDQRNEGSPGTLLLQI